MRMWAEYVFRRLSKNRYYIALYPAFSALRMMSSLSEDVELEPP